MTQSKSDRGLLTNLPIVEEVLAGHGSVIGRDLTAYRNHAYRVANLCIANMGDSRIELEKVAVAAVFHDLAIWTNHTFDYIPPSVAIARQYLAARGNADWIVEIEAMIRHHHKITPAHSDPQSLVESFRRADWIDVARGSRTFGLSRTFIASLFATWPSEGFHRRLVQLTIERFRKHPLTPLPMLEW